MMNNIQKYIDQSNDEAEKSFENYKYHIGFGQYTEAEIWRRSYMDFSEHAAKLTLLLNSENEKQR